jgi:multiple sugar transport system substrate-binding protein
MVISVFSENPGAALKFIDYVTSPEQQLLTLRDYSQAAVISDVYDDPQVRKKYPFAPQLRDAVGQAKSRPVSPVYPQISQAIYENVSEALEGSVTPKEALEAAQADIEKALETF